MQCCGVGVLGLERGGGSAGRLPRVCGQRNDVPWQDACRPLDGMRCFPAPTPPVATPTPAESARLLGVLIRSAPKLVLPYTAPVLRALVGKLRAAGSSAAAANTSAAQPNIKPPSQGALAAVGTAAPCWHLIPQPS